MPYWSPQRNVEDAASDLVGSGRCFGVELEVSCGPAVRELEGASVFGCKEDGSVRGDGLELFSPILQGNAGLEAVNNLCDYAAAHNWDANESCGYHLHLDARNLSHYQRRMTFYAYALTQDVWRRFVPRERITNSYVNTLTLSPEQIRSSPGMRSLMGQPSDSRRRATNGPRISGRYQWVNMHALSGHNTIEIRLHNGTVDKATVTNWIKAHLRFVDYVSAKQGGYLERAFAGTSEDRFAKIGEIWNDAALVAYYRARARQTRQGFAAAVVA